MEKIFEYAPKGVCSSKMIFKIKDNIINDVKIIGGCPGNSLGVSTLCKGKRVEEVIDLLKGIRCGGRPTSCPDQLAEGLTKFLKEQ